MTAVQIATLAAGLLLLVAVTTAGVLFMLGPYARREKAEVARLNQLGADLNARWHEENRQRALLGWPPLEQFTKEKT